MRENIYNFFEHPKGFAANFVQVVIFILIITSVVMVSIEFLSPPLFYSYEDLYHLLNHIILGVFTIEYVLRLSTAPHKFQFIRKPLNVVDFLAIAPNYVELLLPIFVDTTELRVLRLIRILRFARMLRLLKILHFSKVLNKVLKYQGTILEQITPLLVFFVVLKGMIWFLETENLWIRETSLGQLFAIVGFALGIILSQKIGVSYEKFLRVGEATFRLYGALRTIRLILDRKVNGLGTKLIKEWANKFITLFKDPASNNFQLNEMNEKLYEAIAKIEPTPAYVTSFYLGVCQDAVFCLSKKIRLTPGAYDRLLHQATVFYVALLAMFIPGLSGMISVVVATYMLYGMYYLTQELDNISGDEFNLIKINIEELEHLVKD